MEWFQYGEVSQWSVSKDMTLSASRSGYFLHEKEKTLACKADHIIVRLFRLLVLNISSKSIQIKTSREKTLEVSQS